MVLPRYRGGRVGRCQEFFTEARHRSNDDGPFLFRPCSPQPPSELLPGPVAADLSRAAHRGEITSAPPPRPARVPAFVGLAGVVVTRLPRGEITLDFTREHGYITQRCIVLSEAGQVIQKRA
jgi:hypothetical protein